MTGFRVRAVVAAAGSAALLAAALAFQYLGGLAPCPICIWQRWPHVAAVAIGAALVALGERRLAVLGAAAMATGALLGIYHTGIERDWWAGPTTCTAPVAGDLTPEELLERILETPVVLCDQVAWSFFGLSMASWNALACVVLTLLWLRAYASSSASQ